MRIPSHPNLRLARIFLNDISQVELQRFDIRRLAHTLEDIDHDGCEAVFVQVDFLVVGDLTDFAVVCVSVIDSIIASEGQILT